MFDLGLGAATLISGALGFMGQSDTNEANVGLAREKMAFDASQVELQRQFSAAQAKQQMDFQERMANTSWQRGVKDMEAAGLNPMLAYMRGGASAPGGAAGSSGAASAQMPQLQNAVGAGVASASAAMSTIQGAQQLQMTAAQIEQVKAAAAKIRSETLEQSLNSALAYSQLENLHEENRRIFFSANKGAEDAQRAEVERKLAALGLQRESATFTADVLRRKAESELSQLEVPRAKADAAFYEGLGKVNPYLRMFMEVLRGGSSAVRSLR